MSGEDLAGANEGKSPQLTVCSSSVPFPAHCSRKLRSIEVSKLSNLLLAILRDDGVKSRSRFLALVHCFGESMSYPWKKQYFIK
mmetsp:Transcript_101726/g.206732  ORF Transcript_101726/g.206732 Transcript_101726/m.206732 type:complete len:84 (+) Transcript_101726:975-1226(+)